MLESRRMDNQPKKGREDQKPQPLAPHVPPDQRARVAASNAVAKVYGLTDQDPLPISYYTSELIQCTLPHSDPQTRDWIRKNGNYALIVSSGVDENAEPYGIPYGSFPRLVLAHIITRTVATRERRVELSSHFATFLKEIGYTSNHKGNGIKAQRVRDQLLRLLNASISFQYHDERRLSRLNLNIAPRFDLWWDFKKPEEDDFYQTILESPVPLRTDVLKALKKSPLALDVYMWLSYRLFRMQAAGQSELTISYGALQEQFGTGIADENYRQFRAEFKHALVKVAAYWRGPAGADDRTLLNYDLHETGLTLFRSPLLVGRGQRRTTQEDSAQIISDRRFDAETRKKAQLRAGTWSVPYLEQQYFAWIEREGIAPKNLSAHFLSFISRHRKLHKETI